jgi:hypothetical protein
MLNGQAHVAIGASQPAQYSALECKIGSEEINALYAKDLCHATPRHRGCTALHKTIPPTSAAVKAPSNARAHPSLHSTLLG